MYNITNTLYNIYNMLIRVATKPGSKQTPPPFWVSHIPYANIPETRHLQCTARPISNTLYTRAIHTLRSSPRIRFKCIKIQLSLHYHLYTIILYENSTFISDQFLLCNCSYLVSLSWFSRIIFSLVTCL